jgi:hypothetical protein
MYCQTLNNNSYSLKTAVELTSNLILTLTCIWFFSTADRKIKA